MKCLANDFRETFKEQHKTIFARHQLNYLTNYFRETRKKIYRKQQSQKKLKINEKLFLQNGKRVKNDLHEALENIV